MPSSTVLQTLGPMPVARFMRSVWQRRPLLIRRAFPGFTPPIGRDDLFRFARRADVESRLIRRTGANWTLEHGPFDRLPPFRRPHWTLLVQGVDLIHDAANALLGRFRFVPDARLDDLMVSYATDGGGVGPHVDSYDVFLLQATGRRRWRISRQADLSHVAGAPLKLLANFSADEEWVLEPGDMLYLPPNVAHDGIALGECLTYSIGFRAPTFQELLEPWLTEFAESSEMRGRYADPGLAPTRRPGELGPGMVRQVHRALMHRRPDERTTRRFLLRYLTEPKAQVVFRRPSRRAPMKQFARRAARSGLFLDRATRMMYAGNEAGINGEWLQVPAEARQALRALADRRRLDAGRLDRCSPATMELLYAWYAAGWLTYGNASSR